MTWKYLHLFKKKVYVVCYWFETKVSTKRMPSCQVARRSRGAKWFRRVVSFGAFGWLEETRSWVDKKMVGEGVAIGLRKYRWRFRRQFGRRHWRRLICIGSAGTRNSSLGKGKPPGNGFPAQKRLIVSFGWNDDALLAARTVALLVCTELLLLLESWNVKVDRMGWPVLPPFKTSPPEKEDGTNGFAWRSGQHSLIVCIIGDG